MWRGMVVQEVADIGPVAVTVAMVVSPQRSSHPAAPGIFPSRRLRAWTACAWLHYRLSGGGANPSTPCSYTHSHHHHQHYRLHLQSH